MFASAASNIAVDNMAERLLAGGGGGKAGKASLRIVRVGHPVRLLPSVLEASLDARLATSDGAAIVRDVKNDLDTAREKLRRIRQPPPASRRSRRRCRPLRKELTQRQKKSVSDFY